jgi:peptidoglycan-associated lipoprotein
MAAEGFKLLAQPRSKKAVNSVLEKIVKKTSASRSLWLVLAASAVLAGCASSVPLDQESAPVESRTDGSLSSGDIAAQPAKAASVPESGLSTASLDPISRTSSPRTQPSHVATDAVVAEAAPAAPTASIIYFDFDSFAVRKEFAPLIDRYAKQLQANPKRKLLVEGHADERGGREYNLALGQKRAEAVQKSLRSQGVADSRMEAVSLGEERPADTGHNEMAWARNRRAEMKDR